jgi:hypothetical protein
MQVEVKPIVFRRPMVDESAAMALTGAESQEEIIALIEEGRLRWAWNVARPGASRRREVRILGESINEFLAGAERTSGIAADSEEEFSQVQGVIFPSIVPRHGATVRSICVARALNISSDQALMLGRDKALRFASGTKCKTGQEGSPRFDFSSVVEFLKLRRLT